MSEELRIADTCTTYGIGEDVAVSKSDLELVTGYFGERNWPDTKVGNAAARMHNAMINQCRAISPEEGKAYFKALPRQFKLALTELSSAHLLLAQCKPHVPKDLQRSINRLLGPGNGSSKAW